jgi:YD repeat-containing protein
VNISEQNLSNFVDRTAPCIRDGVGYVYDFENHVIQAGAGITMVYDGDGNRVQKTVAGVTTKYLVDTQSPTGYAQVAYETFNGSTSASREISRIFVYGLERISQFRSFFINGVSHTQTTYYVYDGHGSVRALTKRSPRLASIPDGLRASRKLSVRPSHWYR